MHFTLAPLLHPSQPQQQEQAPKPEARQTPTAHPAIPKAYGYRAAAVHWYSKANSYTGNEKLGALISGTRFATPEHAKDSLALTAHALAYAKGSIDILDRDGDGLMSKADYIDSVNEIVKRKKPDTSERKQGHHEAVSRLFNVLDRNKDNKMSVSEYATGLLMFDDSMTWLNKALEAAKQPKIRLGWLGRMLFKSRQDGRVSFGENIIASEHGLKGRPKATASALDLVNQHFQVDKSAKELGLTV